MGKRSSVGLPVHEPRILQFPCVAPLILNQSGIVIASVEVLQDAREYLRLLFGQGNSLTVEGVKCLGTGACCCEKG